MDFDSTVGYANIFHFTNGSGYNNIGNQIPSMFTNKDGKLRLYTNIGTEFKYNLLNAANYHPFVWYEFEIEQKYEDSKVRMNFKGFEAMIYLQAL